MPEDDAQRRRDVGRRVAAWRRRRGLTRQAFADLCGRSLSWVDKIESGERALLRLPMLERVAEALSVTPEALTEPATAQRAAQCVDGYEVQAIQTALGRYPSLTAQAGGPVSVAVIKRQAEYLDHAWLSSRFTVVARHLPRLMSEAQTAVLAVPDAERVDAYRVLVTAYRLASSMLLKFEVNHIAWLAADRAMHTALAADDTWSLARATRSVARAMTSSDQGQAAIATLQGMADRMRPELAQQEDHLLALYGMLHLAASITAAEQEDAALARDMHREAEAAAERMAPHYRTHHTHFGITNVQIHRVAALVRLYEAGRALEFAGTISPAAIALLSPERRVNYLLDLTEAHTRTRDYREAARLLTRAEQVAPEEVRCRPLAHGLLRSLLSNTTGEPARLVRAMAERAGVAA
jgi:transcriptional regulator with XRE-family HTH domain